MESNALIEDLAGRMYDRYCVAVGGVAFNGDSLPKWAEFGSDPTKQKQANGWREAAKEALGIS